MRAVWSLASVALAASKSQRTVTYLASAGLLPGYRADDRRRWQKVSREVGGAFATVLRSGAYSREFAAVVRDDPAQAMAAAEAIATLARASMAARTRQPQLDERAA